MVTKHGEGGAACYNFMAPGQQDLPREDLGKLKLLANVRMDARVPAMPMEPGSSDPDDGEDLTLQLLDKHTSVLVTGNCRTKQSLVGLKGVVKKAVGLGGWHWLLLSSGEEVRLQRNALTVLAPPTGQESVRCRVQVHAVGSCCLLWHLLHCLTGPDCLQDFSEEEDNAGNQQGEG